MVIKDLSIMNYRRLGNVRASFETSHGVILFFGDSGRGKTTLMDAMFMGMTNRSLLPSVNERCINSVALKTENNPQYVIQLTLENENGFADIKKEVAYSKSVKDSWKCIYDRYTVEPSDFLYEIKKYSVPQLYCLNEDLITEMRHITSESDVINLLKESIITDVIEGCKEALGIIALRNEVNNVRYEELEKAAYLNSIIRRLQNKEHEDCENLLNEVSKYYWENMNGFGISPTFNCFQLSDMLNNRACLSETDYTLSCLCFFLAQRSVIYNTKNIEPFPIFIDGMLERVSYDMIDKVLSFLDNRKEQVFIFAHSVLDRDNNPYEIYRIKETDDDNSIVVNER